MFDQKSTVGLHESWGEDPCFRFPRAFIRDSRLSGTARVIAAWMASHSPTYRFGVREISAAGFGGRDKIRKALAELDEVGYLTRHRERAEDGTLGPVKYLLHPTPQDPRSKPAPENQSPAPGSPESENQALDPTSENDPNQQVTSSAQKPGPGFQGGISNSKGGDSKQEEQERSVSDDGPADSGADDVSEAAAPRSDAPSEPQGFSPEDIRGCVKDPAEVSDGDAVVMAKRADEVVGWGFPRDQVCELLAGARKRSIVKEFLARTASPGDVSEALAGSKDVPGARPDVDELCDLLADGIAYNGFNRPTIDRDWRKNARLLLDKDYALQKKIDLEGAKRVLGWAMNSDFWGVRGNIQSMGKFRQKFERLARDAREEHKNRRNGGKRSRQEGLDSTRAEEDHFGEYIASGGRIPLDFEAARRRAAEQQAHPGGAPEVVDGDTGDSVVSGAALDALPSIPM